MDIPRLTPLAVMVLQKGYRVSIPTATKAMGKPLVRNPKRGVRVVVEGAQSHMLSAALRELETRPNDGDEIGGRADTARVNHYLPIARSGSNPAGKSIFLICAWRSNFA